MVPEKSSKQAVKAEEVELRDYELIAIISPEVIDEKLEAIIDNISKFITERGGIISGIERWGKRKLAYPIKHFMEGSYVLTQFKAEPALSKELEARLQISEEVVRHLVIKLSS
jgi:small subunit ribosomal protein S6